MHIDKDTIDTRVASLGRGVGAMRLEIGEGLVRLEELGGVRALGFPSLEAYAREALGRSGRWSGDARGLARRLAGLPCLRAALLSGRLSSSVVELVCRIATPDDDATWVEEARHMTVRALRARLKAERNAEVEDDAATPKTTITLTVDRLEALAFERARAMVEALGATRGEGTVEALLAEGLGELLAVHHDVDLPAGIGGDGAGIMQRGESAAAPEDEVRSQPVENVYVSLCGEARSALDIGDLDRRLRAAARELAWRDIELAGLARTVVEHELWRALGFASFDHYCRERIGLAPSSVASRVALARRVAALPAIEEALGVGRIGYEAASLVARVASGLSVDAWIERAEARTVKHLREEIEAVELVAKVEGRDVRRMGPPDAEMIEATRDVERAAIATVTGRGQMSGGDEIGQSMEPLELPTTTLRLTLSPEVAGFWRALERLHAQLEDGEASFLTFLVRAVTRSWAGAVPRDVAYADIYQRDRWRCASPVCRSRHVTTS